MRGFWGCWEFSLEKGEQNMPALQNHKENVVLVHMHDES